MKLRRQELAAIAGAFLVAVISVGAFNQNPLRSLTYYLGLYDKDGMTKKIEETIKHFNRDYATLYNTGGPTTILGSFPADNLIKRRILQEIRYWDSLDAFMVYDKDTVKIEKIDFPSPDQAVVVAKEIWYISAQNVTTRKPISTLKRNPERIRYLMRNIQGKWRVMEYEVYDEKDTIPVVVKQ